MKKKNLFNLFPKRLSSGTVIYYYTCYNESGKRVQFSTGESDLQQAYIECYKRLAEGKIVRKSKLYFNEYTKDWFVHGKCVYASVRIAKGRTYSKSSTDNKRRILHKHILPVFSEKRLDHISSTDIENWLKDLKKSNYAVNSINNYLNILRLIIGEAKRVGLIDRNPCDKVIKYKNNSKEKEILSDIEVEQLFHKEQIDKIWSGSELHYLINYTAKITGARIGEILALSTGKLKDGYIEISESYDRNYGLKCCKAGPGSIRYVPVPNSLIKELRELSLVTEGQFIFSGKNKQKPVSYKTVLDNFKKALANIEICEDRIKKLGGLHSYRHFAVTRMRKSGIPDPIVREIIGHKSVAMSDNYTHIDTREIEYSSFNIG